ncbi:protein L [Enterobacter kobei]|nr:protein L [Enterobacter kobei]
MAYYVNSTKKYLSETEEPDGSVWRSLFTPATECPASGIYRCYNCGDEVTCNKGDPLPPQNHKQHDPANGNIAWELIVMTKTK